MLIRATYINTRSDLELKLCSDWYLAYVTMYRNFFISVVVFTLLLNTAYSIVCTPGFCAAIQCKAVKGCEGPNKVIKAGGFCQCCDVCYTILKENEECSSVSNLLQGSPPPTRECGKGLVCYEGKCRSFKALSEI